MIKSLFKRVIVVLFAVSGLIGCSSIAEKQELSDRQKTAMAMFQERCKKAGEFIHRTVENVDGIYLLKIRTETNFDDQFKLDDPYGHDSTGDMYILNFLRGFHHQKSSSPVPGEPQQLGFYYVEAINPQDAMRYRYIAANRDVTHTSSVLIGGDGKSTFTTKDFVLERVPASGPLPRYGVTYEDISTRDEREYWIAGSSLKVIDLKTNEVIAERIGYMVDWAQGSKAGGRSPWLFAADNACPGFQRNPLRPLTRSLGGGSAAQPGQTLFFVEKVLKPSN